jgi:hypothetical protein
MLFVPASSRSAAISILVVIISSSNSAYASKIAVKSLTVDTVVMPSSKISRA